MKRLLLVCLLALPCSADLERARRLLDEGRYAAAVQEAHTFRRENPKQSELLQIWALAQGLGIDQARERMGRFRPDEASLRMFLLVRSQLGGTQKARRKDLLQALEQSERPADRVEVLLLLFYATFPPEDADYWRQAAELAGRHGLPAPLLARLSLVHLTMERGERPAEAWADLAVAQKLDPSAVSRYERGRAEILETAGKLAEARQCRWRAMLAEPDAGARLRAMLILLRAPGDWTPEMRTQARAMLPSLARRDRLAAFRARELLGGHGAGELEAACRSQDVELRLLALMERARREARANQLEAYAGDLREALKISLTHPHSPGNEVFRATRPVTLGTMLGLAYQSLHQYEEAERCFRQSLSGLSEEEASSAAFPWQCLMAMTLRTGQVDKARQALEAMMQVADAGESPQQASLIYAEIFNQLLIAAMRPAQMYDVGANHRPIRMDPDVPAGWLFEEIRNRPELQARILAALERWRETAGSTRMRALERLYRGLVLASLDRSLEAIDLYTQGLKMAEGTPDLQANIAILLSHELLAEGRREEALEAARLAYRVCPKESSSQQLSAYRLGLAAQLLEAGKPHEAMPLLEEALAHPNDSIRPLFLLLRGRTLGRLEDLKEALRLCQVPEQSQEVLLALQELQPEVDWLAQIKERDPRLCLRLIRYYQKRGNLEKVVQLGQEGLTDFRLRLDQLPASARPKALQSPSARALLEGTLSACLELGRSQQAAEALADWRRLQAQPALVNPELDALRAELIGLQAAGPGLEQRLADTRAQFLIKLSELRQRNPEVESALSAQGGELLALQPHLDDSTLLVQYYLGNDGLYVQSVTRQGQSLSSVRVEKARLLELLGQWRKALQSPRPLGPEEIQASRQLYSLLVAPLREQRAGHPTLWIMPSGELWGLPFETLQDESGRYLVESASCAYLGPSEALQLVSSRVVSSGRWLGAGNARLPGTLRELSSVRALFQDGQVVSDWPGLGAAAGQAGTLHLATHSVAHPDRPLESFLELADGPVSLSQIYGLALAPGSLVVLSSCSGAVAQQHRERDLISLSSGFRAAGASSVVAALWPVDDEGTALFFPPMYEVLLAGGSRQQALRRAKLAMLARPDFAHPFFWGAFTLLGDPR